MPGTIIGIFTQNNSLRINCFKMKLPKILPLEKIIVQVFFRYPETSNLNLYDAVTLH